MSIQVAEIRLSKGFQFTLPVESRKKHGLKPGNKIRVIDMDNEIILKPKTKKNLKELEGIFKSKKKFDVVKEHDLIISGFD